MTSRRRKAATIEIPIERRVYAVNVVLVVAVVAKKDQIVILLAAALLAPTFEAHLDFGIVLFAKRGR